MAVVIAAVAEVDEPIWKVSSEKFPHITLLYLDDNIGDLEQVVQYVRHAAETSLPAFFLTVERRGILGDELADVLFFNRQQEQVKRLENFRHQLLAGNLDIFKAYHAVDQYPEWIPHSTLGYPENPAKPVPSDFPLHSVRFDRIAIWTGDYEGVDFPLSNNQYELSMTASKGEAFLQHYGIKGMKWGVRRADPSGGSAKKPSVVDFKSSDDHRKANHVRTKAKVSGVDTLTNQDLQVLITRMNLERQFKDLKRVEHEESLIGMGKKWTANFVTDVLKDAAASWIRRPGSNKSSRDSVRVRSWTTGQQFASTLENTPRRRAIGS